jgi:hypothetical protein
VRRAIATAGLVLALALPAAAEEDDTPEVQRMRFVERGDWLTMSTLRPGGLGQLFDANAYEGLRSGFKSTVVIRIQITPQHSDTPVAEQLLQREAVFDRWNEDYTLRLDQPGGRKTIKVKPHAEVLRWLTTIDDLPVARLDVLPIDQVFVLKMVVELNPVSRETLAEVRRWLSQGNGGGLDRGGALFGSFVSVFYNPRIAAADRVLRIRSQPFFRPP